MRVAIYARGVDRRAGGAWHDRLATQGARRGRGRHRRTRSSPSSATTQLLEELRPVSFAIAYRMLGSVSEAEDIVQEALLGLHRALENGEQIQPPRAL